MSNTRRAPAKTQLAIASSESRDSLDAEIIIANAPDPMFVADLDGKILQANDAVSQLLGFRRAEVLEQSLSRFISSEETREFMAALREVVERGVTRNARLNPRSAWGEVIPTALNASALRDGDGRVIGAIGILRDMRELDRARARAERARAYAESLIKNAPDPVFVSDLDGKILQANDAVSELLGFRPDQLLEQSLSRFISAQETREFTAALREVVEHGVTRNAVLNPRSASGEVIPTTLNASALRDPDGRVIGAIGILRDMRELNKARAYAESLIKNAPDPVFVSDLEGKILQANDAVSELLGFRPDQLLEQSLSRFISPEETREFMAALDEVVEHGVTRNARQHPRSASGEVIPTTLNASALRDSDGQVIGAIGILRDMRELDKARAYAESLIKNAPDPVFVSDLDGKILQANDAVSELLGFHPDDLLEQSLLRFIGPEETREFMAALDEVVERGVTRNARLHPRSASGEVIPTTLNASALRDADGKVIGAIGVLRDMRSYEKVVRDLQDSAHELRQLVQREQASRAELDKAKGKLEQAQQQREEFISMIAHDLGGPLTAVRGYAELLGRPAASPEIQERARAVIVAETHRMARLVEDLADAAHLAAGRFEIQPVPCDLVEITREQIELARAQTDRHEILLDAPQAPVLTLCDRDRLGQVLTNLLGNAIKYTDGGQIQVRLWVEDQQARLSVSDEGPGIPRDRQESIFEPHLRLRSDQATAEPKGSGLGLHIARGIVEAHGGRISVESSTGHGATFRLSLPLAPAPAGASQASTTNGSRRAGRRKSDAGR